MACVSLSHPRAVMGDVYDEKTVTAQRGFLANIMMSNGLMSLHSILMENKNFLHHVLYMSSKMVSCSSHLERKSSKPLVVKEDVKYRVEVILIKFFIFFCIQSSAWSKSYWVFAQAGFLYLTIMSQIFHLHIEVSETHFALCHRK